jgi:hypothetical protein
VRRGEAVTEGKPDIEGLIQLALDAARDLLEIGADGVFDSTFAAAEAHEAERLRAMPRTVKAMRDRAKGTTFRQWIEAALLLNERTGAYANGPTKVDDYELRVRCRARDLLVAATLQFSF